ncbi:MAG: carboxypeptidase-like regulatory domain-containing protein, partial [Duncaniella sp.]|nr:carboxypeptidase-like regulatory domain-containing protein [Duncaniella sp.]
MLAALPAVADNITITGVVRDSLTHEPVPFATVILTGTDRGTLTDDNGRYTITTALRGDSVTASALGFDTKTLPLNRAARVRLDFNLRSTGVLLGTVIAKPKREHYSKKDNPAVEFMERIRATQDLSDPRRKDNYNYDKYERITLAINNYQFNDSAKRGFDKKFSFIKEYIDTSALSGVPILNVALREKASRVHYRHEPESEKEYVKGLRNAGMDEFLDRESMQTFYE